MTKPDWANIKSDYVESTLTLAEVQAKWGVPRGTLSARATRENWNHAKQQFAAKLEHARRESILAKRAAEQKQFESNVRALANGQLVLIARQMRGDDANVLKLASALEKVQRIGSATFVK